VRQAILVVVLVSASFLGGAFVNGPALSWAQTRVLRSLGLSDGGEIASVNLDATASPDSVSDGSAPIKSEGERMRGPLAPVPSLIAEGESSEQDASDRRPVPRPRPKSKSGRDGGSPRSQPSSSSAPSPSTASEAAPLASPSRQAAPLDPSITPAIAASPPPEPAREPAPVSPPSSLEGKVPSAILDTLADLLPSNPPSLSSPSSPSSSSSSSPVALKSAVEGGDDWAVLQRKMQTLGVSRFTIDGDPGGRVVFSCLIPLAGRQAVTQRFEAEGDDLVGAAQAALRRVALWRATQAPSP
jgi:hypothetical protein